MGGTSSRMYTVGSHLTCIDMTIIYLAKVNFKTAKHVISELLGTEPRSQPQGWATVSRGHLDS